MSGVLNCHSTCIRQFIPFVFLNKRKYDKSNVNAIIHVSYKSAACFGQCDRHQAGYKNTSNMSTVLFLFIVTILMAAMLAETCS